MDHTKLKKRKRIIVLGLDGYDHGIAETLMARGDLPHLTKLVSESAVLSLEHGKHLLTGLSWEQFSTGKTPDAMKRWAAVNFDPSVYTVRQRTSKELPFLAHFAERIVVFDAPYFDLLGSQDIQGIVNWGAHDPGVPPASRPSELFGEVLERFGRYPAKEFIYGFHWPSADRSRRSGIELTQALDLRTEIARWLLSERLPDWDLGFIVASEMHSIIEPLWHGVDPLHPLHGQPSAANAREAIFSVYRGLDRMIATLRACFEDATFIAFSMHGMGPNNADVTSMVLLPELCYRRSFGTPLFKPRDAWTACLESGSPPLLEQDEFWEPAILSCIGPSTVDAAPPKREEQKNSHFTKLKKRLATLKGHQKLHQQSASTDSTSTSCEERADSDLDVEELDLDLDLSWMPATQYQPYWPRMDFFSLPAFYDARIRINLKGREAKGRIELDDYDQFCDNLEIFLQGCRDAITGERIIASIERSAPHDPFDLHETQGDLEIEWNENICFALHHPEFGVIGPAPIRRTAGHTGGPGICLMVNGPLKTGYHGQRSTFDIAPTVADLLNPHHDLALSGRSLLRTDQER